MRKRQGDPLERFPRNALVSQPIYRLGISELPEDFVTTSLLGSQASKETAVTTYITRDGVKFTASSPAELIEQLQQEEPTPSENIQDFMNRVARRCQIEDNVSIRTTNSEIFVADLIQNDYVYVIDVIDG
ncbi:MAG: hypothetical protein AB4426_06640 [Xenococcaceae cyanobacterium]